MFVKRFINAWHWDVTFKLHPNAMRAEIAAGARAAGSCSERSFRKTARTSVVRAACSAGRTYGVHPV